MDRIHVHHILVDHEYEAKDVLRKINEGFTFEKAAGLFSKCPSVENGGDLGEIRRGQTVQEFEEAAFLLNEGEISGPVRSPFGYHLIRRVK